MEKIKKILYNLASSESDMANEAYEVYVLLENADEAEVAEYIATHDADMRRLLGVKNLVEKDADKELAEQYFKLYTQGQNLLHPDPYKRTDYYGNELKDVDHYMELLGVPKKNGSYTNDQRAAFTNPESPDYFGKLDPDYIQGRATVELGSQATAEDLVNVITRVSDAYRANRSARGYGADNSTDWGMWLTDLGQEIFAPRIREARLAGREWSWADLAGDAIELGLNFVPGYGWVTKAGKLVARAPKGVQIPVKLGLEALESSAAPLGSQTYDYFAYGKDDPRGQWDWGRVGAQYVGAVGAKGAIRMGARTVKDAANLAGGKANESGVKKALDVVEDIGKDSRTAIEMRKNALKQQSDMASSPEYGSQEFLTAEQNSTGFFGSPDHKIAYDDYVIRAEEAERLAKSQKARQNMEIATQQHAEAAKELSAIDDEVRAAQQSTAELEARRATAKERVKELYDAKMQAFDDFERVNESPYEIVQLPDGRFAYNRGGVVGGQSSGSPKWILEDDARWQSVNTPSEVTVLNNGGDKLPREYNFDWGGEQSTQKVTYAPRDRTVRQAISGDPDLDAVASGRVKYQRPVNTATNVAFNAAAREGIVGQGLDLQDRRNKALWNKMMMQLRPYVAEAKGISATEKKERVNAIMNVLSAGGLDNISPEVYAKAPNRYEEIAAMLGMRGWHHWSDSRYSSINPTNSASSAYDMSSSSSKE